MADLAVVALGIDTSGMRRGAQEVNRVVDGIQKDFDKTRKSIEDLEKKIHGSSTQSAAHFRRVGTSAREMGSALSGVGGPVGDLASKLNNLGGQASGLIAGFGLVGGVIAGVGIAAIAAGAGIAKLALDGVKLSDELADMGQALGFGEEQMERLNAATRISGEKIGFLERTFYTFQQAIQSALVDPTGEANQALLKLGVIAPQAAKNTQAAFLDLVPKMAGVTQNFGQMAAARDLFGRGLAPLIRISEAFGDQLGLTRKQMEQLGYTTDAATNQMAAAVDKKFNEITLMWETLQRQLIVEVGPTFLKIGQDMVDGLRAAMPQISAFFKFLADRFDDYKRANDAYQKSLKVADTLGETARTAHSLALPGAGSFGGATSRPELGGLFGLGQPTSDAAGRFGDRDTGATERLRPPPGGARRAGGGRAIVDEAVRAEAEFQRERLRVAQVGMAESRRQWERDLEDLQKTLNELNAAIVNSFEDAMVEVGERVGRIMKGISLAGSGAPPTGGFSDGGLFGTPNIGRGPNPKDIRVERPGQDQLDQQFNFIFDDFLTSILTARKTLGGAFADLALGIVDTFAFELTKSLREAFVKPLIEGLTDLLQKGLSKLFEGLKGGGGGSGGFFSGLLGSIFGGLGGLFSKGKGGGGFAEGGMIGSGKWGIVGEKGPELFYSGNSPTMIVPFNQLGGEGGMKVNVNFAISTPTGQVDRRTQDQLSAVVLAAVERANRNRGAR